MKTFNFKLLLLIIVLVMSSGDIIAQVNWTKYPGNPVLPAGLNGEWDRHKFTPSILYNADSSRYEMWFSASVGPSVGWRPYRIGFATSEDGVNWTTYPDPVLIPGAGGEWDSNTVESPIVSREFGQYNMWYSSWNVGLTTASIGYATSPDGVNWTKYNGNPIFEAGTQPWEAGGVYSGGVIATYFRPFGRYIYQMWYSAWNVGFTTEAIGYATSTIGTDWQRDTLNNPVLPPSSSGWDHNGVYLPNVLLIDNFYYMWYSGHETIDQIGLATSYDGVNWIKHDSNPVLKPSPGQWDALTVNGGSVMFIDDTLYMWYGAQGGSGSNYLWQIGLATSPFVPLPVELTSFKAATNGNEVILNWSTATELNNLGFEIQRSIEGEEFFTVEFVSGHGTTTEQQNYSFADRNLNDGNYYYRLKQVDFNGSYEYSNVVEIDFRAFNSYLLEQNYPNPFNPTTTIGFGLQNKSNVKITILNAIGEEVAIVLNEDKETGFHKAEFNAASLPSGVYFYQLKAGEFISTKKMLLIK